MPAGKRAPGQLAPDFRGQGALQGAAGPHAHRGEKHLQKLRLVEQLRTSTIANEPVAERVLEILERDLAERLPMLRAFEVSITPALQERLDEIAAQLRSARAQA